MPSVFAVLPAADVFPLPDPGAVHALIKLLIDSDVLKDEYFGCHPCINTTSMKLKTSDIMEKFLPAVHHEPTIVDLPWEE